MTQGYGLEHFTYKEKTESVAYTLHEELILAKVFLVDVQHLGIVEVAHEEQCYEEADDNVNAGQCQKTCTQANRQSNQLTAPEHEVQDFILNNISFWNCVFTLSTLGEKESAFYNLDVILV